MKLTEADRTEFEKWAAEKESDAEGTQWGAVMYAVWESNQILLQNQRLLQQILSLKERELEAEEENLAQKKGLLKKILGR